MNQKKLMTSFYLLVLLHNIMDRWAAKMLLSLGLPNVLNRACLPIFMQRECGMRMLE